MTKGERAVVWCYGQNMKIYGGYYSPNNPFKMTPLQSKFKTQRFLEETLVQFF